MTALDDLRASQHDDLVLDSDQQLWAFLAELDPTTVHLDRTAHMTPIEIRHLSRAHTTRRTP